MRVLALLVLLSFAPRVACDDLQSQGPSNQSANFDVVKTFLDALMYELKQFPYPPVIALIALAFGLVLLFNGKQSFNATVTFAFAAAFGTVARATALSHWQEHHVSTGSSQSTVANVVGVEVALLVAAMTHYGHKGVLVILGAAAGFFVAHFIGDFLVINFHCELLLHVEAQVAWYSLWCLVASIAIYTDKHVGVLALLSPVPGGIFTASALLYFATEAFVAFSCTHASVKHMWSSDDAVCPWNLTPKTGQWIDFFMLGFSKTRSLTGKEDVGIFYNTTFNMKHGSWSEGNQQTQGYAILYDHLLTVGLWVLLSLIGIKVQRCMIRRKLARNGMKDKKAVEKMKADEKKQEAAEKAQAEENAKRKAAAEKKVQAQKETTEPKAKEPEKAPSRWPFSKKESKGATLEESLLKGAGA